MLRKYFSQFRGFIYLNFCVAMFLSFFISGFNSTSAKGASDVPLARAMRFGCDFNLNGMKPRITVHGDTICYYGFLNYDSFNIFKRNMSSKIKFVIIRSNGGDLYYSVKIAELIDRFQPTIIVDGICGSGCANFLFLTADKKVIKKDSFVGFHGSVPEARTEVFSKSEKRKFDKTPPEKQAKFWRELDTILSFQRYLLNRTGVNKDLIYWDPNKRIRKDILAGCKPPNITIWAPSPKTLKSFGVKGLIYAWYPASYMEMFKFGKRHSRIICLVP